MKKEIQILLTALTFYTRINVSKWTENKEEYLSNSAKYLPLIGWLVGAVIAFVFIGSSYLFSSSIAIVLSILSGVLLTGAFHEDGLADVCDGFGGGWDKPRILAIMKDSAIGVYGATGLIVLFGLKFLLLLETYALFNTTTLILFTISAHTVSRFMAVTFMVTHTYARGTDDSKVKSATEKKPFKWLLLSGTFAFIPLLVFSYVVNWKLLMVLLPVFLTKYFLGRYFQKWIDGYTGDCLGAAQQITEIIFYMSCLALWKFI